MAPFLLRSGLPTCLSRPPPRLKIRTMRITSPFPRPPRVRLVFSPRTAHQFDRLSRIGPMMTMTIAKFWNLSMLFQFRMLLQHIRTFIQRLQLPGSAQDPVPRMPRLPRPRRLRRPKPSVPRRPRRGTRSEVPWKKMRKSPCSFLPFTLFRG